MTNLSWVFNHYGPYLDDIKNEAQRNPRFELKEERNLFGKAKEVVALTHHSSRFELDDDEKATLDHVIEKPRI
ncbi:SocA family protein [Arthrobacter sp. ISL-65]|uniref:SocA family protein n=1 Tax=Arthrobacter sp. ISL-65 TaxID=2819112 RepID=UPI001BE709FA|nr:SocA family protein [Arthrobacter sp. ISL-65]MBT2550826.1 hypothetical protein [Arthrobacter sp. ISL-65]